MKTHAFRTVLLAALAFAPWLGAQPSAPAAPSARLTVLVDNSVARPGVKAVWGFACLVEAGGHTVLFDTGADPAVLKDNLAALKIGPARIEAVVVSHYHGDHTLGAPGLAVPPGVPVYTPRSFDGYARVAAALDAPGLVRTPVTAATQLYDAITVSAPLRFEGVIPGTGLKDQLWEQCLVVETADGLAVIAGCSHPGIVAMLEQVKRQSGRPIRLVIGGFHLLGAPRDEVRKIAAAMQALGVTRVGATHCTGGAAEAVFREVFGDDYVEIGAGAVIDLPPAATARS